MKRLLSILLLIFLSCVTSAQRPFSRDYWLNETNTPVKVNALAKDLHGYLWLGTDEGLYRFNGRNFSPIADSAGGRVTAVTVAGDSIFCGYANGRISYYLDGNFHPIIHNNQGPTSLITFLSVRNGCIYACTDEQGIFSFVNGFTRHLNTKNGLSDDYVYSLIFAGTNLALAATDHGINILSLREDGTRSVCVVDASKGLPDNIIRSIAATPSEMPVIWAGMQAGGIARITMEGAKGLIREDSARNDEMRIFSNWHWGQINDVLPVSDSQAWVATEDGYLVNCTFGAAGFDAQPVYFPGKRLRRLIQDNSGTLWCATTTGLTLVTGNYVSWVPIPSPYELSGITAMACDSQDRLYYTQGADLFRLALPDGGLSEKIFSAPRPITSLYFDSSGKLWIGTLGAGLWCLTGKSVKKINEVSNLVNGQILDISSLPGQLWISSLNGVEQIYFKSSGSTVIDSVVHHGKHDGTGSDYVYQLFPDSKGSMWMATDGGGVCMFDGHGYHHWDSSSGFPAKVVYGIAEDAGHRIWAATYGHGLFVYEDGLWRSVARRRGLSDLAVSAIAANATGQVIVVHGNGIDEWYPASGQFRHFNQRLGMNIDSQSNALNCYTNDSRGNVWVPFEHGFILFRNLHQPYDLRPVVVINDRLLFFKHVPASRSRFDAGENHIGFAYDGVNFTNPERLFFRYKLEGYDSGWISTIDESVTFPRLPAGKYHFRVQASFSQDFAGASEAEQQFSIALPFWRQKWAVVILIALLIVAGYLVLRIRERHLRRAANLQRERMVAEYEQLKAQVNPHFLFNSLNTLASLIEEDGQAAFKYTIQLSDLFRSILTFKDRDLIYLSEEWALVQKYIFVQQTRFPGCLHVHATISGAIAGTKRIIPLALQLLIENAIKHNVVSESNPLLVSIVADNESIVVRNKLGPKVSKAAGEGLGLLNISRRYALMTKSTVSYGVSGEEFIVTIPLL